MSTDAILRSLHRAIQADNHEEIYEYANRLLSNNPTDMDAINSKILAALNSGNVENALNLAEASPRIATKLIHIRAYLHYRLGHFGEALKLLKTLDGENVNVHHLEGQIYFKQGKYTEAASIYNDLLKNDQCKQDSECVSNALAAHACASNPDQIETLFTSLALPTRINAAISKNVHDDIFVTYELVFNYSFALLASGQPAQALEALTFAQAQISAALAADPSDDLCAEQASMSLLQAFLLSRVGQHSQARAAHQQVVDTAPTGGWQQAVAVNNLLSSQGVTGAHVADQSRRLETLLQANADKLTVAQRSVLQLNAAILQAWCRRGGDAAAAVAKLEAEGHVSSVDSVCVRAFALVKEKKYKDAEVLIDAAKDALDANATDAALQLDLAAIQLMLAQANIAGALAALTPLLAARPALAQGLKPAQALVQVPALLALVLALQDRLPDSPLTAAMIDQALQHHSARLEALPASAAPADRVLLRSTVAALQHRLAGLRLRAHDYEGALALLEELLGWCEAQADTAGAARVRSVLLSVALKHAPDEAAKYAAALPHVDTSSIDVEALEAAGAAGLLSSRPSNPASPDHVSERLANGKRVLSDDKLRAIREKKRARRTAKLPAGVTVEQAKENVAKGFVADPHRWKPMWERPRAAGKTKVLQRGPQGSGVSENKVEVALGKAKPTPNKNTGGRRKKR